MSDSPRATALRCLPHCAKLLAGNGTLRAMSDAKFDTPEFLALLRAGDQQAYRSLIRRFHGSLVGVAGAIIGSRAHAEEIVQDTWLAAFSGIGRFAGPS